MSERGLVRCDLGIEPLEFFSRDLRTVVGGVLEVAIPVEVRHTVCPVRFTVCGCVGCIRRLLFLRELWLLHLFQDFLQQRILFDLLP